MVLNGIMGLTRHRGGGSVPARSDVSWEHYRLIADNSSDVVYECRPTGEILWVQPTVEHLLGFSPDELIGAQARSLIHPDETEMVDRLRASVYSGAELDEIPCRFRTKAGDYRMCSVRARPVFAEDGSITSSVMTLRDVHRQTAVLRALATLSHGNEVVVRASDEGDLLTRMCEAVVTAGDYPLVWYGRPVHDEACSIEMVVVEGHASAYLDDVKIGWGDNELGRGPSGRAIRTAEPHVLNHMLEEADFWPWSDAAARHGLSCTAALPVMTDDGIDGVLVVYGSEAGTFDDVALSLLVDLATDLGFGLQRLRDAEELTRTREEYRMVAENVSDCIMRSTLDGVIEWVTPSTTRALGWTEDELIGRSGFDLCHPEDLESAYRRSEQVNAGMTSVSRFRVLRRDGSFGWYEQSVRPLRDSTGATIGRVSSWRDVNAEVSAEQQRDASEDLFRRAMDSAAIGMVVTNIDGAYQLVNPSICRLLQRDAEWMLAHDFTDIVHPDDVDQARDDIRALVAGNVPSAVREQRLIRADGSSVLVRRTAVFIPSSGTEDAALVVQFEDITESRLAAERLEFQAFHDPLTGLRNRAWIMDILESDLVEARASHTSVGLLFIDIDNFKLVNESLGHLVGDRMLKEIARRLPQCVPIDGHVGRLGGDEFVVIVPGIEDPLDVEPVAERICDVVAQYMDLDGHGVVATTSIGIAVSTKTSTPTELLRDADAAVYRAKSAGRARWQFADNDMHEQAVQRLTVEDALRRALADKQLVAYYQPIVDLADGSIVGHEALVRWIDPVRGVVPPLEFLGVAEDSGLVVDLGQQMLEQVCHTLATNPRIPGTVSVNVSAVQLARPTFIDEFVATLVGYGIPGERIVVEVTETAVLGLPPRTIAGLMRLRDLGIGLHVDDFGTGYSSIALLRDLPVTGLKLDRSFVLELTVEDSPANALSAGLASLGRSLHLDGVAEGIETREQWALLRAHGWSHGQGYLFGRPAPEPLIP